MFNKTGFKAVVLGAGLLLLPMAVFARDGHGGGGGGGRGFSGGGGHAFSGGGGRSFSGGGRSYSGGGRSYSGGGGSYYRAAVVAVIIAAAAVIIGAEAVTIGGHGYYGGGYYGGPALSFGFYGAPYAYGYADPYYYDQGYCLPQPLLLRTPATMTIPESGYPSAMPPTGITTTRTLGIRAMPRTTATLRELTIKTGITNTIRAAR